MLEDRIGRMTGFLGFLLLAIIPLTTTADYSQPRLKFPYNHVASDSKPFTAVQSQNVSKECMDAFGALEKNFTQALFVADAIGKPAAGQLIGFNAWIGHYEECTGKQWTMDQFKYCIVQMKLNGGPTIPIQLPISWGVCAPKSCSAEDVKNGIAMIAKFANISQYLTPNPYANAICEEDRTYDAGFIGTVFLCSFLLFLVLLSALIEAARRINFSKLIRSPIIQIQADDALDPMRGFGKEDDDVPLIGSEGQSVQIQEPPHTRFGLVTRFIKCFSLSSNMAKLVDSKQSDRSISCLNGLRVISMSWVVLGHTFLFSSSLPIENISSVLQFAKRYGFIAIENGGFAVDSFFFLSGFLVAFLTFMRMSKSGGKIPWFWFYFHRYWRLTPMLLFCIIFYMYVAPYMGQGPFWMYFDTKTLCSKYWWTNLLYINNFYPRDFGKQCVGHAWYLANDMQLFIISPIFLILLYRLPIIGVIAVAVGILSSFATTAALVGHYNLNTVSIISSDPLYGLKHPAPYDYNSLIYGKPYCRISVYLVGILMGYVLYRIGNRKVKINPIVAFIGWLLAAIIAMSVVYGSYPSLHGGYIPTLAASIIYDTLSRFAWSVVLAWVLFACNYGYGGWINSILSWSGWIIWSRLTYTVYLVHPLVLYIFYYNFGTAAHFSIVLYSVFFVGNLGISYGLASVLSLVIEYPFANIEKLFMPIQTKRTVEVVSAPARRAIQQD